MFDNYNRPVPNNNTQSSGGSTGGMFDNINQKSTLPRYNPPATEDNLLVGLAKAIAGDIIRPSEAITKTIVSPLEKGLSKYVARPIAEVIYPQIKEAKKRGMTDEQIYGNTPSITDFSPAGQLTGVGSRVSETPLEFAGNVLQTATNVYGGGALKNVATQGIKKAIIPLAKESGLLAGANTYGRELASGTSATEAILPAVGYGILGAAAAPAVILGGTGLARMGGKAIQNIGSNASDELARIVLPRQIKTAVAQSQENLNKVLDNLSIPNVTPNSKTRDTITYVRSQFPNLQEEVAVRSGQPIKTKIENGVTKFETANQADIIQNKAYTESQNAAEIARQYDDTLKVSNDTLLSKLDSVLGSIKLTNTSEIRTKAIKMLNENAKLFPDGLRPSFVDSLRSKAGLESSRYDDAGNLVGDSDLYSILSKVYKDALSETVTDPNYVTSLRNSADNFELARLLKTLHNKEATLPKSFGEKTVRGIGTTLDYLGRAVPFNFGTPVEYLGKLIKTLPNLTVTERKLASTEIEKLIARAQQVGAKFSDSETRVLNFIKRLEKTNATKEPIDVSVEEINAIKNLEGIKQNEDAIKFFNKQIGDEIFADGNTFGIDLTKYYKLAKDKPQTEINKITDEIYKAVRGANKPKKTLPTAKIEIGVPNLNIKPSMQNKSSIAALEARKLNTPKPKGEMSALLSKEEIKYYDDIAKTLPKDGEENAFINIPDEVKKDRLAELTKLRNHLGEQEMAYDMTKENIDSLQDTIQNFDVSGGLNLRSLRNMMNSGTTDIGATTRKTDKYGNVIAQKGKKWDTIRALDANSWKSGKTGEEVASELYDKMSTLTDMKDQLKNLDIRNVKSQLSTTEKEIARLEKELAKTSIPKELQPLAEEAKKYKSAEEFVKAQGTPIYHRTPEKVSELKINSDNPSKGIHFYDNKEISDKAGSVKRYGENQVFSYVKGKIKDLSSENWQELIKQKGDILNNKLLEDGYVGYKIGSEIVVFDAKAIKTKQQLIDLYNQVKGKK